ncbi:MAG TPA: S9 family peptidase [Pyrinomonadaceae bacterium]|jgi:dipeptidyl aminopeptidase/acylaminoacyl peptidase|nr:S9 family peptidase [Pyrinomonadaceae bacterium]
MTRFTKLLTAALFLLLIPSAAAHAQGEGWTPELMMKVRPVGPVRVSPDGRRVAYVVTDAVMTPERSEYVSQIYVANSDGTGTVQLTFADKSSTNPQWSPDGRLLAFTSTRKDNKSNLYVLRLDSGGEAEPLTDVKTGVTNFAWSPDSKWLAFTMRDPKTEAEEKSDKGRDDWRWVDENAKLSRLYLLPVEKEPGATKREPRKLTDGAFSVDADFDWSPDGRSIVFAHTRTGKVNDWPTSDVSVVEVSSGRVTPLAATPSAELSPRFSPDGKQVALVVSDNPPRWAQSGVINVIGVGGGAAAPRAFAASHDAQPNIAGWSPDGRRIYFTEARGTGTRLYALDTAADKIAELNTTDEVLQGVTLNRAGTVFGFAAQASDRAPEAFTSRADSYAPVQVSRANADIPKLPLGKTEVVRWKSPDGKNVEGLLTYPVGYRAGTRVPLILNVHGGPAGVFQQTFTAFRGAYPIAAFAARGYAVLRPNPRGSSGYGAEFRRANIKDWGFGDFQDLMSGVDKVIEMGVADPERLGVMGWSYGGYMTSWTITQTKRFKAASAGAPVTNLMSFTGTADIPGFIPDYFGGQPWEALDLYRKHSPMFNVRGVTTPTMIQHGEADERVPVSQGYELYNALRAQGVPARMLVLPRQPHGPNEPKMILKVMQTNLEWFDKYLGQNGPSQTSEK